MTEIRIDSASRARSYKARQTAQLRSHLASQWRKLIRVHAGAGGREPGQHLTRHEPTRCRP